MLMYVCVFMKTTKPSLKLELQFILHIDSILCFIVLSASKFLTVILRKQNSRKTQSKVKSHILWASTSDQLNLLSSLMGTH